MINNPGTRVKYRETDQYHQAGKLGKILKRSDTDISKILVGWADGSPSEWMWAGAVDPVWE